MINSVRHSSSLELAERGVRQVNENNAPTQTNRYQSHQSSFAEKAQVCAIGLGAALVCGGFGAFFAGGGLLAKDYDQQSGEYTGDQGKLIGWLMGGGVMACVLPSLVLACVGGDGGSDTNYADAGYPRP